MGTIGPHPTDTLLGYLPPVGWADVATKRDLDHFATQLRMIATVTLLIAIVATGILTR